MTDKSKDKSKYKLIFKYLKNYKFLVSAGFIMMIISIYCAITTPKIVGAIIEDFFKKGITVKSEKFFYYNLFLFAILAVGNACTYYLSRYFYGKVSSGLVRDIRKEAFSNLQKLPVSYFDNLSVGNVVSRITNDTKNLQTLFDNIIWSTISSGGIIIGVMIVLVKLAPIFLIYLLIVSPIVVYVMYNYTKWISKNYNRVNEERSNINSYVHEDINGIKVIQAYNIENIKRDEFEISNRAWLENSNKINFLESLYSFNFVDFVSNLSIICILLYFGVGKLYGFYFVSIGILYVLLSYINTIFSKLSNICQSLGSFQRAIVALDKINNFLKLPLEEEIGEIFNLNGDIEFENVEFSYVENEIVLNNINFKLEKGKTMAFVGATGSGKSSIMNLIYRFYDPQKGKITLAGKDIKSIKRHSLRKNFAIVLQEPYLFEGNIYENIALGNENITEKDAIEAMKLVGIDYLINNDLGIKTIVTEKGNKFSYGEKQLICFARALAHNPDVLILDEATANVDTETENKISDAINLLKKDRTTLIIAHRLSTIKNADGIIVLNKGNIIEKGSHTELMSLKGEYFNMYEAQKKSTK